MGYRVLKPDEMPLIERECPECDGIVMMRSTGMLLYDEGPMDWCVDFYCPLDREDHPMRAPKFNQLIDELTVGVDPTKLPLLGPGKSGVPDSKSSAQNQEISDNAVVKWPSEPLYRVLELHDMPRVEIRCGRCEGWPAMPSTGRLLCAQLSNRGQEWYWFIELQCPGCKEYLRIWDREYAKLIDSLTRGFDPKSLPLLGTERANDHDRLFFKEGQVGVRGSQA